MPLSSSSHSSRLLLSTGMDQVRGVGPRVAEKLARIGVTTVEDALYTLPLRYEDRREIKKIASLREGIHEVFFGEIMAAGETFTSKARRRMYEVLVADGTGRISLKWFRYRKEWMKKKFIVGRKAFFTGEVQRFGGIREVHHPDVEFLENGQRREDVQLADPLSFGRILPVYPLTEGFHQKSARRIWKEVVDRFAQDASSPLPEEIIQRQRLLSLPESFQRVHWPPGDASPDILSDGLDPGRRSLVFDEFFYLELGLALKHRGVILEEGFAFQVTHRYTRPLAAMLPYRLTDAQRRVLGEIKRDMMAPHPMNRLVQGDVGSGKTIVALMAALIAIENDTQVAVVAPTEILAEQHYLQFHGWMERLGLRTAYLAGSTPAGKKKEILQDLVEGNIHLVVGTHAVLQEGVEFRRLGLGIVDEQHRFGVRQRGILKKKGQKPDILVMTATPIPRTLALTAYGDLTLSVIDEMPPGRSPVQTRVLSEQSRDQAYRLIDRELGKELQAYIVYPLVEESEKSELRSATEGIEHLEKEIFPDKRLGLLHGRMKPEEKEAVMAAFKSRKLDILVSTTVIEVGIDVPNASVMMVEHAERFGLAQLHQLRGRVGRGTASSYCLLIRSPACSEEGLRRLQVMAETTDGFRIAEADLEIRGPGEFLGIRQSGLPDFRVADLLRDGRTLEDAREEAFRLAENPDFYSSPKYEELRRELLKRWGSRLELAGVG